MRPDPKYVIDLAHKLEAAKATLATVQELWDALFPEVPENLSTRKAPGAMRGNSAINRTLEFFNAHSSEKYNAGQAAAALGIPVASMRTNLAKLFSQGKLRKVADGLYQAAEQVASAQRTSVEQEEQEYNAKIPDGTEGELLSEFRSRSIAA